MIHHIVMFRLEGTDQAVAEAASSFKTALEALPARIEALEAMNVHIDNVGAQGNWTLVLHAECPDRAALEAYAGHPDHVACVGIIKPLITGRACVDYEV